MARPVEQRPHGGCSRDADNSAAEPSVSDRPSGRRLSVGETIDLGARDLSSAIYGSLLVTMLIEVEWLANEPPSLVAASILAGVVVFWIAHTWAALVALRMRGPVGWNEIAEVARDESPMLLATPLPVLALVTSRLGVLTVDQAIGLALVVSIGQLFAWGVAVGRALQRGPATTLLVAVIDVGLGLLIIGLEVVAMH